MPTPAQSAISLMVGFAEEHEGMRAHLDVWRELGVMLDADGTLDQLDESDARHAITVIVVDCPDGLRGRADWIESGAGASPLHDPAAVVAALRRVSELVS